LIIIPNGDYLQKIFSSLLENWVEKERGRGIVLSEIDDYLLDECISNQIESDCSELTDENVIYNQKKLADYVSNILKKHFRYNILYGGAPRNWYLNMPARDLDFYILLEPMQSIQPRMFEDMFECRISEKKKESKIKICKSGLLFDLGQSDYTLFGKKPLIERVIKVDIFDYQIDLVLLRRPYDLRIDTLDDFLGIVSKVIHCNFSTIGYHDKEFVISTKFYKDHSNNTITYDLDKFTSMFQMMRCLVVHTKKMLEYFPDKTIIFSGSDEWFDYYNITYNNFQKMNETNELLSLSSIIIDTTTRR